MCRVAARERPRERLRCFAHARDDHRLRDPVFVDGVQKAIAADAPKRMQFPIDTVPKNKNVNNLIASLTQQQRVTLIVGGE